MQKLRPRKNSKDPVLTDFERYKNWPEINQTEKYFLFCRAAGYHEIIQFIIDSFNCLGETRTYLYLVTNGAKNELEEIRNYIDKTFMRSRIKMFSNLTNQALNDLYKNAIALLIPLRPTLQDEATFPRKIGEYLASGVPVISTNYGEVKHYFRDGYDMLIASSYDKKPFAAKMQFVLDNPSEARKIGSNGKQTAGKNFDYKLYGSKIVNFMNSLRANKILKSKRTFSKI